LRRSISAAHANNIEAAPIGRLRRALSRTYRDDCFGLRYAASGRCAHPQPCLFVSRPAAEGCLAAPKQSLLRHDFASHGGDSVRYTETRQGPNNQSDTSPLNSREEPPARWCTPDKLATYAPHEVVSIGHKRPSWCRLSPSVLLELALEEVGLPVDFQLEQRIVR